MNATEENIPSPRCLTYSQRFSNELNVLSIDHCYAKPWSSHPEASNAKPLHMLFMEKFPRPSIPDKHRSIDIINVVDSIEETSHTYDSSKSSMSDCEKLTSLLPSEFIENREDWEEHIASIRTSWSVVQNRNFAKVMRILQADRLARLSIIGIKNEHIQRRLQIDKAAKRVRSAFANVGWDMTVILWLHNLFLENLRGQLLTSYLEVLQTLKVKIPLLVDRLMQGTNPNLPAFNTESLTGILKKNWDPVMSSINQQKLKKLPENPLLLLIPNAASTSPNLMAIKRQKFWHSQLIAMGKVMTLAPFNTSLNLSIVTFLESTIANARTKILELKSQFPGRPLILIGWQVGALVAIHIASMEVVHGVICLGFPTMGINGSRGDIDDSIYNCRAPTLFVVGQNSSSCSVDVLEDIRERLRVETQLVLVGGADDQLRMSRAKKQSCNVTQTMVDRCIMDEMYQFLCQVLSQVNTHSEMMDEAEVSKKQRKRKQKEISNTAGSQTVGLESKVNFKPVKALKLAKAVGYTGQLVLTGKIAKKSSPKKKLQSAGVGSGSNTKLTPSTSSESIASLSKVSEAEAIASAPELSNLLQNMKKFDLHKPGSNSPSLGTKSAVPQVSTTIPSTTALTLSKFLQSSGLLRAGSVMKSSSTQLKESEKSLVLGTDTDKQHDSQLKQPQILLRAGTSSSPFSIPLTLNMANKVLKATPMMKITGSNSNSAQIQQLLSTFSNSNSSVLVNSVPATNHSSLNTFLTSSASTAVTHTPVSSVINMGSETVLMKESPASTTSVPCTVSIDLGHISQAASSTLSVMKFMAPTSKISLISNIKQIPMTGTSEKHVVSSQPTIELIPSKPPASLTISSTHLKPQQVTSISCTSSSTGHSSLQLSPSTGLLSFKESDSERDEDKQIKNTQNVSFSPNLRLTTTTSKFNPDAGTSHSLLSKMSSNSTSLITTTENKPGAQMSVVPSPLHVATSTSSTVQVNASAGNANNVAPTTPRSGEGDSLTSKPVSRQSLSSSTPVHTKAAKSTIASYTATPKTILSTSGSTRTRRIRTPKQYDL